MKVLAFGEILWDIINGDEYLGGAPFNFAAHAAKCGNEAYIITRLGDDFRGLKAFNRCREFGVANSLIQWDHDHPTGIVDVVLNGGQPDYTIVPDVAYDFIEVSNDILRMKTIYFDVLYFGTLAQRTTKTSEALEFIVENFRFGYVFYDVNLRKDSFSSSVIERSLRYCTVLKMNIDEVAIISKMLFHTELQKEEFCKSICDSYSNISIILITASDKGCFVFHHDVLRYVAGEKVNVNDAVGAGDAFSAAFMHATCLGLMPEAAASIANRLGAYVTTQRGAIPQYTASIKQLLWLNQDR